jgi:hypothetical protein
MIRDFVTIKGKPQRFSKWLTICSLSKAVLAPACIRPFYLARTAKMAAVVFVAVAVMPTLPGVD